MGKITCTPKFWSPNANERVQNTQALLRADNLVFEEDGVVKTGRGTTRVSSGAFGTDLNTLYSQSLLGSTVGVATPVVKVRYVSSNGSIVRNYSGGSPTVTDFSGAFLTGGDSSYSAFGNAWGHTFAFSGTKKRADKGASSSWRGLGIPAASAPTVSRNTPPSISVFGTWTPTTPSVEWEAGKGTYASAFGTNDWMRVTVDSTSLVGILRAPLYGVNETLDLTNFGSTGQDTPNDIWSMLVRVGDTSAFTKVRLEILLDTESAPGSGAADVKDYFWYEWYNDAKILENPDLLPSDIFEFTDRAAFIDKARQNLEPGLNILSFFREGEDFWGSLQCLRSQFRRSGTDASKSWSTVKGIRIIIEATADLNDLYIGEPKFIGGENGPMNGWYSYIQVNVNETGDYTEVGLASPAANALQVINGSVNVTPAAVPGNVNKVRIYRSSTQTPGYYLVKEVVSPYAAFNDTYSDIDALRDGVLMENYRVALPDGIRHVVMPYYDRALYFDTNSCYPSYRYDPGSYDARHEFRICGTDSEIILWVTKTIDGVILVGTTNDIYAIRGDFSYEEETQLLKFSIESLGVKQVPISSSFSVWSGNVIYLAEDGWRMLSGSSSITITDEIDLLYRGSARHGIGYALLGSRNENVNVCTVAHNKLYCAMTDSVDGRSMHIYDFVRKQWTFWRNRVNGSNTPLTLFSEEDGTIIFSTGSSGDKYVYTLDTLGSENALGEGGNNSFFLLTPYLNGEQPNNRKVPFTLKIRADSNNETVTLTIRGIETSTVSTVNFSTSFNGTTPKYYDISSGLGNPKFLQVELSGTPTKFILHEIEIVYDSKPEQLSYLLIQPDSKGTDSRKRVPAIPFEIDTLGNNTYFVPILDGVSQGALLVNTTSKTPITYKFPGDKLARAIGGYFYSNVGMFEFYGMLQSSEIEVVPEALNYKWLPANNLGTSRRKRISQVAFVINCNGQPVTFTPYVNGTSYPTATYSTTEKALQIYTFDTEVTGIEIAGSFYATTEFEFYGLELSECMYEALPPVTKFHRLSSTNLGSTRRKRISQIGYVVDCLSGVLTFTPYIDGVAQASSLVSGTGKTTYTHVFPSEVTGTDIGFTLASVGNFEFYELSMQDTAYEILPPATRFHRLQSTNFGTPSKKRIRTLAFSIDTKGQNVVFTPIIDGVSYPTSTFNTTGKRTALHYFNSDVFGIDFSGTFTSSTDFEFYEQLSPLNVETLPVGRLWDQLGPMDYNRQAKVKWFRLTLLPTSDTISYTFYSNDVVVTTGIQTVIVGKEQSVEIPLPYGVNVELLRVEITSAQIFHRIKAELKLSITGHETEQRWVSL